MDNIDRSKTTTTWALLALSVILAVVIAWIGFKAIGNVPAPPTVHNWHTNVDGRYFCDLNQIDKAVEGKSRAQVLNLLGNPDAAAPQLDVFRLFRPRLGREVLYYALPKYGVEFCLQAIELSNDKVVWTYRTMNNPLWIFLYAAIIIGAIWRKWIERKRWHSLAGQQAD